MMKKRTTLIDNNVDFVKEARERFGLSQQEATDIMSKFQRYDTKSTGFVGKHELDDVLRGSVFIVVLVARFGTPWRTTCSDPLQRRGEGDWIKKFRLLVGLPNARQIETV